MSLGDTGGHAVGHGIVSAIVVDTPADEAGLFVRIPAFGEQAWGPCGFPGADQPAVDVDAVVVFDETGRPWVVAWD